jgi:hypothetical protein
MNIPAAPRSDDRLSSIEHRLERLERSKTNSPSFWARAWAITGHTWAVTGVIYAALIVVGLVLGVLAEAGS